MIAAETGNRVGAAWLRVFREESPGYGFVDERTPELTISVVPSRRRHGLGQELLDALLAKAREARHPAVSLSVEVDSPAVAFYERNGFEAVRESDGGLVMRRDVCRAPQASRAPRPGTPGRACAAADTRE